MKLTIKEQVEENLPGVTLNLQAMSKAERLDKMQKDNYDVALTRWGPDYADPMTYLGMWITNNANKDIQEETGSSYMFIAHDLSMVKYISDRIGVLHLGHMLETGTTEEIINNPVHPYTRSLISAIPLPNPVAEKKRKAVSYDHEALGIDYNVGSEHLIEGTHSVFGTDEQIAEWTAK